LIPEWRGNLSDRCRARRVRKGEVPGLLTDGSEHVEEGWRGLGAIPGAADPPRGEPLLEAGGVPEQHQVVDEAGHRCGAGDGRGGLVLGILEAEELLLIVKRDLNQPSILHL
jgi:hypothetical protein